MRLCMFCQAVSVMAVIMIGGCRSGKDLSGGIRLRIDSLYVRGDTLWFGMEARNASAFNFRPAGLRFSLRDRHPLKRKARQELSLPIVWSSSPFLLPPDTVIRFNCGLRPRIPGPGRNLWIEWIERNGDRRVRIVLTSREVMRAKRL